MAIHMTDLRQMATKDQTQIKINQTIDDLTTESLNIKSLSIEQQTLLLKSQTMPIKQETSLATKQIITRIKMLGITKTEEDAKISPQ